MTRNYVYETRRTTDILGQLKWESLKKRRKDNRIILLYKGLKDKARIPTDDLIPNKNIIMSSFKSSRDIQKKEGGPDSCFG